MCENIRGSCLIVILNEGGVAKIIKIRLNCYLECGEHPTTLPLAVKLFTRESVTCLSTIWFSKLRFLDELRRWLFLDCPRFF